MSGNPHKPFLWLVAVLAVIAVTVFLLTRTRVGEMVMRETAKVFDYEYIPNQKINIDSTEAARGADSVYTDFRWKFRFHYQGIGMASFSDSSRMMLLSDLPPHFETDSVAAIFSEFTHKTELRRHPIGYDGYTTDLIILLGNATQENCDRLIKRLNEELFFSDYKPIVTTLPSEEKRCYFATDNFDYQISLSEFNTWFMEEGEGFIRLDDSATVMTIPNLFDSRARGVYFSQQPGFVAWAVAKDTDITPQIKDIRQFTLDADLILGALADSNTLVIIGRERQSPLYELPPLQIESILLLASTTEKELSQSLDINDLMAGKMCNGRDWCPTYFSRELENTEFGDLMTITDILLKDWSERGTIRESYYRYPEPGYYPFDQPLFRKLGLNELVYNWNTAGAMYAIDQDGYTIYTLGRTGSLPVSYFNSQERSQSIGYKYESQAYHYFSTLGCTDLARVVQYTALYQLFIDNNISYSDDTAKGSLHAPPPNKKAFLLYKPTTELLNALKELSGDEINCLADSLSQRTFRHYQREQIDKQLHENEQQHNVSYSDENRDLIYNDVQRNTQANIRYSIQELKEMLRSLSDEQFKQLARHLSYPRGVKIHDRDSYNTYLRAQRVNQLMRQLGKNNLDLLSRPEGSNIFKDGMDLANVKNWYAATLKTFAGRYMKTASLIVTFNDLLTTGGHNLSSRINRVNSMTNYKHSQRYTPTDYPREGEKGKEKTDAPNAKGAPYMGNPAGQTTRKPTNKLVANQSVKPSATKNVRPRSTVIPSAPRPQRGL